MTNLSDLLPAGGSAKEATAIASGNIATGQTIVLKSNGQIEAVSETQISQAFGTTASLVASGNYPQQIAVTYDTNVDRVFVCYYFSGSYPRAQIGTVSGSTITFGTETQVMTQTSGAIDCCFDESQNKVIVVSYDNGTTKGVSAIGTITSGTNIVSFSSTSQIYNQQTDYIRCAYDPVQQQVLAVFRDASSYGRGYVGTTSGSTTTWGGTQTYSSGNPIDNDLAYSPDDQCFCVIARNISYSDVRAYVLTIAASQIVYQTQNIITSGASYYNYLKILYNTAENKFVVALHNSQTSDGEAYVGTIVAANLSMTFGGANQFSSNQVSQIGIGYDPSADKLLFVWRDDSTTYSYYSVGTQSGNTINFTTQTLLAPTANYRFPAIEYDPDAQQLVLAYQDHANGAGEARMFQNAKTTTNNTDFIGIAAETISSGNSGKYNPQGGVGITSEASAGEAGTPTAFTGGLRSTDMKAVFDSGSNQVVFGFQSPATGYGTSIVGAINSSNNTVSFGTSAAYQSMSSSYNSIAYDASADKIVAVTADPTSSNYYGVAYVGTVTGTGISFSSGVEYRQTQIQAQDISYDSTSQKVVICWTRATYGESAVGTISGGAITFGSMTEWQQLSGSISYVNTTYDSNADRTVVAYQRSGTGLACVVGQVSGTSITWGSRVDPIGAIGVVMSEGGTICFDSQNNKVIIPYKDNNSSYGTVVVCTVSGSTLSGGTPVPFTDVEINGGSVQSTFDSNLNKVIITYCHQNVDNYLRVVTGTVSGTSITFDTPVAITSTDINPASVAIAFDPNVNKTMVGYNDNTASAAYGAVYLATGSAKDLTIDATYYVQGNGELTQTSGGTNIEVGKAVSTTQLLLKGAP